VADGVLYFGDYGGHLGRINIADGFAPLPWLDLGAKVSASPAISDGRLYVGAADGKLYCLQ
jgi:outer membrane protein assembly factor BamB